MKRWSRGLQAALFLLTLAAFWPGLHGGFVNWDDDKNFLLNPYYRGFTLENLRWMFTHFHSALYTPLTWLTLAFDYTLWGMNPTGYHVTSLLLHAVNALLFYGLAVRLLALALSAEPGNRLSIAAAFAAAVFALHPLRVESVVWITERRDVLSGLFVLLTVHYYLRRSLAASLSCFLLSLLAKPAALAMPVVLAILDVYPLRRWRWEWPLLQEKLAYAAVACPFAMLAVLGQRSAGASTSLAQVGFSERLAIAFYGAAFYVRKTLLPFKLSAFYPRPPHIHWTDPVFALSAASVIILTAFLIKERRRWPALGAAWAAYLVLLAPTSGLFQSGPQITADRYSYLSCMSWALMAGGIAYGALTTNPLARRPLKIIIAVVLILAGLTWEQSGFWKDSVTLWHSVLARDPRNSFAQNNLGEALRMSGHPALALSHYEESLKLDSSAEAAFNMGAALADLNRWQDAIPYFELALSGKPEEAKIVLMLGQAYLRSGDADRALQFYQRAAELDPSNANTQNNVGALLATKGRLDLALPYLERAAALDPGNKSAADNLAAARQDLARHPASKKRIK